MKYIFIGILFMMIYGQSNAQAEFAPIGAQWYHSYTMGCCPEEHFNYVISEKDTIVDGDNCRVLRQYYDNSDVMSERYIIKQEHGKVYYYYQEQFHLLFDFDAQINDTVKLTFMYKYQAGYDSSPKDTVFSARFIVENITTDQQNLKTIKIKILDEDVFVDSYGNIVPHYSISSYTEKIGFHTEFMPMLMNAPFPAAKRFWWLRCYSDDDYSIVSDEWNDISLPCNYSYNINVDDIQKEENIEIFPNPFNNNLFVRTDNGKNIKITDISGKIIHYSKLSKGINEISTNHFSKGIFFVEIQSEDNSIQVVKIAKP